MQLKIEIPETDDLWDGNEFVHINKQTLVLAHSLVSVYKWERKWKKPFFSTEDKTAEELTDYIRCMTVNTVDERVYSVLTPQNMEEIGEYMNDPMTSLTFHSFKKTSAAYKPTSAEQIYFKMLSYGIPVEFERWHINSLLALIHVFDIEGGNVPKLSKSETAQAYMAMHNARKKGKK